MKIMQIGSKIVKKIFPSKIWYFLFKIYMIGNILKWRLKKNKIVDVKKIPIIINNYNRLTYLKLLIDSLVRRGYNNIFIIDNNSTYPPLLKYYENCPFPIFKLSENLGYQALWKTKIYNKFKNSYYVYTDPDVMIEEFCPEDFLQIFFSILVKYPFAQKVGFGLRIDDLPDNYINKKKVIEWEIQFWKNEVASNIYRAHIDTTFALYRPFCGKYAIETYRTGYPYLMKHLPWYVDSSALSEEEKYYITSITQPTHWSNNN